MGKPENAFELHDKEIKVIDAVTVAPKERDQDRKPGLYLILGYTASNDDLAMIDPALKSALFQKRTKQPEQSELPGTEPGGLSEPKFDFLKGFINIDKKFAGYELVVANGIDEKSHITVPEVDIDNLKIKLINGGSVYFQYRLALHVSEALHGKLSQMKNQVITITLTAPESTQGKLAA